MPYVFKRLGGGLNLKAPATAIPDDALQEADNCRFDSIGAVESRRGRLRLNQDEGTLAGQVRGHGEFVTAGGAPQRITKAGDSLYENEGPIGTFTGTDHISVQSYNGYAYITDGTTQKRWNGTVLEDWGLDAPTSLSAVDSDSGGSLVAGTYKYAVTFYNDRCESNLYPDYDGTAVTGTVTTGTSGSVALTIPTGPANCTGRRIYSTVPGGSSFFELKEIADNTTTSWTDTRNDDSGRFPNSDPDGAVTDLTDDEVRAQALNVARGRGGLRRAAGFAAEEARLRRIAAGEDAQRTMTNLGVLANWTDHDKPPTDLKNLRLLNGQIFGTSGNSLRWSRTFEPEHWPDFHEVPIGRQGGETLLTIEPFGDNAMACYTTSGVWLFEQLGISAQDARLRQIPSPVGAWGQHAVTRLENGAHLFGGGDSLYLFDGERVQEVGFSVEEIFTDSTHADYLNALHRANVAAGSYRDKAYFAYATGEADGDTNDRVLFVDFQDPSSPRYSVHSGDFTTLVRMEADNSLVGGTETGELYEIDFGDSDGGTAIAWSARTKEFAFEEGETVVKRMRQVVVDCDTGSRSAEIEVRAILDDNAITATKTVTTDGRERVKFRVPPTIQGHTVSVRMASTRTDKRALYGVGFDYEVADGL